MRDGRVEAAVVAAEEADAEAPPVPTVDLPDRSASDASLGGGYESEEGVIYIYIYIYMYIYVYIYI